MHVAGEGLKTEAPAGLLKTWQNNEGSWSEKSRGSCLNKSLSECKCCVSLASSLLPTLFFFVVPLSVVDVFPAF